MRRARRPTAKLSAATLVWLAAAAARAGDAGPPDTVVATLVPEVAVPAIGAIPDPGRKLLALRSYLRSATTLEERWSWSEEQIAAFQGSAAQQAMLAEVAAISAHFAEANPGYEIYANTKVRSLEVQIERWNANDSVGIAAQELLSEWAGGFCAGAVQTCPAEPEALKAWLVGFRGSARATLAAPGLTRHGQAHAIDFQIMKDGEIFAGADSHQIETVWRTDGWDMTLKESILAAGPSFEGPLASPDEPWHYDYDPPSQAPETDD